MAKILEFTIDGFDDQRLRVRVRGRERPDSMDSDDRNWLQAVVEVRAGNFAGSAALSLRTEDVADLRRGLARMTDDPAADAQLKTMEDRLALRVARSVGQLVATGHVGGHPEGNRLEFKFGVDAGGIPGMLQDLDEILDEYPIR